MKEKVIKVLLVFVLIGLPNNIHAQVYKRQPGDEDRVARCEEVKMLCKRTRQNDKSINDDQDYKITIRYNQGSAQWLYCDYDEDYSGPIFGSPRRHISEMDMSDDFTKESNKQTISYSFHGYNSSKKDHFFIFYTYDWTSKLSKYFIVFSVDKNEYYVLRCDFYRGKTPIIKNYVPGIDKYKENLLKRFFEAMFIHYK